MYVHMYICMCVCTCVCFSSDVHLFLQLLNGLVAMDTTVLLEVVVVVMCREERHAHEDQMQMKLVEFVKG